MIKHGAAASLLPRESVAFEKLGKQALSKASPSLCCTVLMVIDLAIALERSLEE